jgi:hypothetical protein
MQITEDELWDMVYQKLDPLIEKVKQEFELTEEYQTKKKHDEIIKNYLSAKKLFEDTYGTGTYDYCYDVFGQLQNADYVTNLKNQRKAQQEYQERSYQNSYQSNYNGYFKSGYSTSGRSNYTDDEKKMLKQIYRLAAKNFHPDITKDDGTMMKFLSTRLKEEWGI